VCVGFRYTEVYTEPSGSQEKNTQKEKRSIFLGLVCELDVSVDAHAVQVVMEMADGV